MQDDFIRTKRDSQNFGIGEWCAFLFFCGFFTLHGIIMTSGISYDIWQVVLSGDYGQTDLINAIVSSVVLFPLLLAFYSTAIFIMFLATTQHRTTIEADEVVLTSRSILGFTRTRRVPIGQIIEVGLDQQENEGSAPSYTLSIKLANKRQLDLTRPEKDSTEMEALADRLRTALRSAGWTDASVNGLQGGNLKPYSSTSPTPDPSSIHPD